MLTIAYRFYFFKFDSAVLDQLYLRIVIRLVNMIMPAYFKATSVLKKNSLATTEGRSEKYVVSLTTFPSRITKVWITIETILRQQTKPDEIILWLSADEFNGRESLPASLTRLEKRGLQIKFCNDNLKPHKKYFYTVQEYPNANIITVDDDLYYPPDLIGGFLDAHQRFPDAICCNAGREIGIDCGIIAPYDDWTKINKSNEPSFKIIAIGGGGTLFPKKSLNAEVLNVKVLKEMALYTDDLWLKVMSLLNQKKVVCDSGKHTRLYIPVFQENDDRLAHANIGGGRNNAVFTNLVNFYKIPVSIFDTE